MRVNAKDYYVKDISSGASITVKPYNGKTRRHVGRDCNDCHSGSQERHCQGTSLYFERFEDSHILHRHIDRQPDDLHHLGQGHQQLAESASPARLFTSRIRRIASANPIVTATTDASGNYSKAVTPGTWYVAAGLGAYNTSADQIVTVTTANVGNINFSLVANASISGKVTKRSDGTAISGASVYFSTSPNAASSPTFTATTDSSGNYTQSVQNGTWYVAAGGTGYYTSVDQTVVISGANVPGINFSLKSNTRNIPRTGRPAVLGQYRFAARKRGHGQLLANVYPVGHYPDAPSGSPTVDVLNGIKWEHNNRISSNDGFMFGGEYTSPIAVNGVTIVAAVKPTYCNPGGEARGEVVDIFYGDLFLAVGHTDGQVIVCRRSYAQYGTGYYIPNGQKTILSLVVSPTGVITLYANGVQKWSQASGVDYTTLQPGSQGYMHYIDVGRNNPDGWSAYNGDIGDVFVYKVALTDAERQTLETDLYNKFLTFDITASSGANGSVTPAGVTTVDYGSSQTYTITPNIGYKIATVLVDGVNNPEAVSSGSYTFSNVTANHTISATFAVQTFTITASAGTGGSISPPGITTKNYGTSQAYTIAANSGYVIGSVIVDGVSQGAISTYTFNSITANHTISATFTPITYTITASAGTGGTISPRGPVSVNHGTNKTFTIAPNDGYAVVDVIVDGVSQGALTTYTFNNVTANHTISATFAKPVHGQRMLTAKVIGRVVDKTSDTLTIGNQVANLIGYVRDSSGIEPYLELTADPTGSGNTPIPPVALGCRSVLNDPNVPTNTVTGARSRVVNGRHRSSLAMVTAACNGHGQRRRAAFGLRHHEDSDSQWRRERRQERPGADDKGLLILSRLPPFQPGQAFAACPGFLIFRRKSELSETVQFCGNCNCTSENRDCPRASARWTVPAFAVARRTVPARLN